MPRHPPPGKPIGARSVYRYSLGDLAAAVGLTRGSLRHALRRMRRKGLALADGPEGVRALVAFAAPRLGWRRTEEKRPDDEQRP